MVEDATVDGQPVQVLKIEWQVEENTQMNDLSNCYVSLLPPGGEAYRLEKYGDGIDDGDQVTELRIAVVDELSDAAYHDAADLVAYVTTRNRADGAVCH